MVQSQCTSVSSCMDMVAFTLSIYTHIKLQIKWAAVNSDTTLANATYHSNGFKILADISCHGVMILKQTKECNKSNRLYNSYK